MFFFLSELQISWFFSVKARRERGYRLISGKICKRGSWSEGKSMGSWSEGEGKSDLGSWRKGNCLKWKFGYSESWTIEEGRLQDGRVKIKGIKGGLGAEKLEKWERGEGYPNGTRWVLSWASALILTYLLTLTGDWMGIWSGEAVENGRGEKDTKMEKGVFYLKLLHSSWINF